MCSGWVLLEALYRSGSRWQVGFDDADCWDGRVGTVCKTFLILLTEMAYEVHFQATCEWGSKQHKDCVFNNHKREPCGVQGKLLAFDAGLRYNTNQTQYGFPSLLTKSELCIYEGPSFAPTLTTPSCQQSSPSSSPTTYHNGSNWILPPKVQIPTSALVRQA
jgi:hypothetical protein